MTTVNIDLTQHPKCSLGLYVLSSLGYYLHPSSGCSLILEQILQATKVFSAALRKLEVILKTPEEAGESFNLKSVILLSWFTDSFYLVSSVGLLLFTCLLNVSVTQDCVLDLLLFALSFWVISSRPRSQLSLAHRWVLILYLHYVQAVFLSTYLTFPPEYLTCNTLNMSRINHLLQFLLLFLFSYSLSWGIITLPVSFLSYKLGIYPLFSLSLLLKPSLSTVFWIWSSLVQLPLPSISHPLPSFWFDHATASWFVSTSIPMPLQLNLQLMAEWCLWRNLIAQSHFMVPSFGKDTVQTPCTP